MIKDIAFDIENVVNLMDCNIYGKFDAQAHMIETCDAKYSRAHKHLFYLNDQSVVENTTIDHLEGDNIYQVGNVNSQNPQFFLQKPFFVSGTHISANREWSIFDKDLMKKTPLIWLLETTRLKKFGRESVYAYTGDLRIFFLDETNPKQYKNKDHLEQAVNPMHNLANLFLETIAKDVKFKPIDEYELITFARFGVERQDGIFQNIIDANLSGVELRLTLTKYKENCNC